METQLEIQVSAAHRNPAIDRGFTQRKQISVNVVSYSLYHTNNTQLRTCFTRHPLQGLRRVADFGLTPA